LFGRSGSNNKSDAVATGSAAPSSDAINAIAPAATVATTTTNGSAGSLSWRDRPEKEGEAGRQRRKRSNVSVNEAKAKPSTMALSGKRKMKGGKARVAGSTKKDGDDSSDDELAAPSASAAVVGGDDDDDHEEEDSEPTSVEEQEFRARVQESQREQDEMLDQISHGMNALKEMGAEVFPFRVHPPWTIRRLTNHFIIVVAVVWID
jgi:hypothetical protein